MACGGPLRQGLGQSKDVPVPTVNPAVAQPESADTAAAAQVAPDRAPAAVGPANTGASVVASAGASGTPVRLRIPRLGIDSRVVGVGRTPDGNMAAPASAFDVAWYAPGPRPGEAGNAAMTGHLDDTSGQPAAFWRLHELKAGDRVYVTNAPDQHLVFEVYEVSVYPYQYVPRSRVFGRGGEPHLNLYTCHGLWMPDVGLYDRRFVAYSRLVGEGQP